MRLDERRASRSPALRVLPSASWVAVALVRAATVADAR
eukprot:COSAG06_NODE_5759_length_3288_cov_52.533082_4_plen_38_part_00